MDVETSYLVKAPRSSELAMWLKFNDLDPLVIPLPSDMFVESDGGGVWWIRYTAYVRTKNGSAAYNPVTKRYAYAERRDPLVYDPPMSWLVEQTAAAPEGDGRAAAGPVGTGVLNGCADNVADGAYNWG
jgi:hypothetical protein